MQIFRIVPLLRSPLYPPCIRGAEFKKKQKTLHTPDRFGFVLVFQFNLLKRLQLNSKDSFYIPSPSTGLNATPEFL